MTAVLRTEDQPAPSRLDYWRHVVGNVVGSLELSTDMDGGAPGDYRGRLAYTDLGGGALFIEKTAAPLLVHRTPGLIRQSDPGLYEIEMHTHGSSVLVQDDYESLLRTGEVFVKDSSRPYRMAAGYPLASRPPRTGGGRDAQLVSILVPHALLPVSPDTMAAAAGTALTSRSPTSGLLPAALARLARCAVTGEETSASRLATVVTDLLAIELANQLDRASSVPPETRQRALVCRIKTFVDAHLGDTGLSPVTIAEAHHISLRYLHKLFEPHGVTVSEWVRSRRLERCHNDLIDPTLRNRTIAAIAARWGFTDTAYFTRLFRATYGLPPATYRRVQP